MASMSMASPGFCSRCGSKLNSGSNFCSSCGVSTTPPSNQTQPLVSGSPPATLFDQSEYVIDKKILALRDTFAVKNRQGELLGYVKKKIVSLGPQFWFEDLNGQRLGEVQGKILTIHHTYKIFDAGGAQLGAVKKKIMKLLGTEWWLEAPPGMEVARVHGNILNHDYVMANPAKGPIAQVHKKWVTIRDSYCIEVLDASFDRLLVLGFAIAMDSIEFEGH